MIIKNLNVHKNERVLLKSLIFMVLTFFIFGSPNIQYELEFFQI